jgi:hypothetical protein
VIGYDERAAPPARRALAAEVLAATVQIIDEPTDLPTSPDLVVLATPDAGLADLALRLRSGLLADPWRLVARERWLAGTEVLQYGLPTSARPYDEAFAAARRLWADPPGRAEGAESIGGRVETAMAQGLA